MTSFFEPLSQGGQAVVLRGYTIHSPFVCKVYNVNRSVDAWPAFIDGWFMKNIPMHDCIIRPFGVVFAKSQITYYMESMPMDLWRLIIVSRFLTVDSCMHVAKCIASALTHLHGIGVAHRDIKPENVLIGLNGRVKICDFGNATVTAKGDTPVSRACATLPYVPPETYARDFNGPLDAVDIWAAGVTIAEMILMRRLFGGESSVEAVFLAAVYALARNAADADKRVPRHWSAGAREAARSVAARPGAGWLVDELETWAGQDLKSVRLVEVVLSMMTFDPSTRPSARDALQLLTTDVIGVVAPPQAAAPLRPELDFRTVAGCKTIPDLMNVVRSGLVGDRNPYFFVMAA